RGRTQTIVYSCIFGPPVIASRVHATADVCDEGVIEYYEPGDPADPARAIKRLHGDPARRAELAANGKRAEERSGWAVQQERFLGVYRELVGEPEPGAALGATSSPGSSP